MNGALPDEIWMQNCELMLHQWLAFVQAQGAPVAAGVLEWLLQSWDAFAQQGAPSRSDAPTAPLNLPSDPDGPPEHWLQYIRARRPELLAEDEPGLAAPIIPGIRDVSSLTDTVPAAEVEALPILDDSPGADALIRPPGPAAQSANPPAPASRQPAAQGRPPLRRTVRPEVATGQGTMPAAAAALPPSSGGASAVEQPSGATQPPAMLAPQTGRPQPLPAPPSPARTLPARPPLPTAETPLRFVLTPRAYPSQPDGKLQGQTHETRSQHPATLESEQQVPLERVASRREVDLRPEETRHPLPEAQRTLKTHPAQKPAATAGTPQAQRHVSEQQAPSEAGSTSREAGLLHGQTPHLRREQVSHPVRPAQQPAAPATPRANPPQSQPTSPPALRPRALPQESRGPEPSPMLQAAPFWAELPADEPITPEDEWWRVQMARERRERIDREQGGSLWNG